MIYFVVQLKIFVWGIQQQAADVLKMQKNFGGENASSFGVWHNNHVKESEFNGECGHSFFRY